MLRMCILSTLYFTDFKLSSLFSDKVLHFHRCSNVHFLSDHLCTCILYWYKEIMESVRRNGIFLKVLFPFLDHWNPGRGLHPWYASPCPCDSSSSWQHLLFYHSDASKLCLASVYASQLILSRSAIPDLGRVAAARASTAKIPWVAWLGLLLLSSVRLLQACYSHTVRGVSERGPAINEGSHQIQYKVSVGSRPRVLHVFLQLCFLGSPWYYR